MHTGSEGATPLGKLPGMEEDLTVNTGEVPGVLEQFE